MIAAIKDNLVKVLLAFSIVFVFVLFKQCQTSSKVSELKKTNIQLQSKIDTLSLLMKDFKTNQVTKNDCQRISEKTMYQFLIFEDDVDKGKMSLGEIQLKLKDDTTK